MKDNRLNQIGNLLRVEYYPCYCTNGVWAKEEKCEDCGSEYKEEYRAYIKSKEKSTEDLIKQMFKNEEEKQKALELYRKNQTF